MEIKAKPVQRNRKHPRKKCVNLLQQGSAVPYNWFLPVISGFEGSNLLMTDKRQSDISEAYGMYLENHILKYIKKRFVISNYDKTIQDIRGEFIRDNRFQTKLVMET